MKDEIRCKMEIREDESRQSPGRLYGEVITEGERSSDRAEVFERGALKWDGGIILNRQHKRDSPIMRVTPERRGSKIVIDQPLPNTQAGRDAAEEIRSGLFKGLSVEFRAVKQAYESGVRMIREAVLGGVGLVDNPSYTSTVEVREKAEADEYMRKALSWL